MRLEISNNNGTRYLRIVESVWVEKGGKKVSRKRTIKNIGPVSKFDDGEPDFEQRLRESFTACKPLIPELIPFVSKAQPLETYTFQITEGSSECVGHPKLYSQCLIERILEELGIVSLINSYKGFSKLQYDVMGYLRLLIYGRILNPASKISTVKQNEHYYEAVTKDTYDYNIYDTLDFIYDHKKQIFNRINSVLERKFGRKSDIVYYDVTNFYFETEDPDEDMLDEAGTIVEKGLRKMGVSKENRKQPIVQMGLFMDNSGYPISYEIFPGNTLDHLTVRQSLKNTVDNMEFGRFLFVGDRGMCSNTNIAHILSLGNGYVVSKSIAKSSAEEKKWIFDDTGYTVENPNFKYKSRVVTKTIKDEDGVLHTINEKAVVYWDRHFYERQKRENKSFLEFLEKLIASPNAFRITATQSKMLRKFLKDEYLNLDTGELLETSKLRAMMDMEKVNKYKQQFGYYQIVSSELHKSEKEIIEIYHGLSRIEDQFRVMKGDLSARPMFVSTKEHIDAHLAVCPIALTVMRIIQNKVAAFEKPTGASWSYAISAERVRDALNAWTVERLPDDYFRFNNIDNPDLMRIFAAFGIEIPKKLYRRQELKSLRASFQISR